MVKSPIMELFVAATLLFTLFKAEAYNVCENNNYLCSNQLSSESEECNIKTFSVHPNECSSINFSINDKTRYNLGDLKIEVKENAGNVDLMFKNIKWRKLYLKISDYDNTQKELCKMYSVASQLTLPLKINLNDDCFFKSLKFKTKNYLLEYKAENKLDIVLNKFVFELPNPHRFGASVHIYNKSIFSYIDFTDNNLIVLKLQPLPQLYDVNIYKVEIFKEKDKTHNLMDVRMFPGNTNKEIVFEYVTYNIEGYYFFAVSIISEKCPEDFCRKTYTPKVYIHRKGTPLVIGIVGASFIIPFILFVFHMLSRKYNNSDEDLLSNDSLVVIFKPSSNCHCEVINVLAKILREFTGKDVILEPFKNSTKLSSNIIFSSYIIYILPPAYDTPNCEMDETIHTYLKENIERNETRTIVPIRFTYSCDELPNVMKNFHSYTLPEELQSFLNIFEGNKKVTTDNNLYQELSTKIQIAQQETELKNGLNMPKIIVTEQSDCSDSDPKEFDGLL